MADIFLSHASEDHERARVVAAALEARGWSVWWDRNIPAGKPFDEVIEHELEHAKSVVVLWSKASVLSEWVRNEATSAAKRGVLLPAQIDAVQLPLEFRRKQTVDLVEWSGDDSHVGFKQLCEGISLAAGMTADQMPPAAVPSRVSGWRRRWPWAALATVIVAAVAALWINRLDPEKRNAALIAAANQGEAQTVQALLGRGMDLTTAGAKALEKVADSRYSSPYNISEQAQVETLRVLLEAGADPNARYAEELTPLMLVVRSDSEPLAAVKTLIKHGADVNAKCDCSACDPRSGSHGCGALLIAASKGHRDTVMALLDKGARVNDQTDANRTALMLTGKADIVRTLLQKGADPNIQDSEGKTALMWAVDAFGAGLDGVQALLERGADVNAQDGQQLTVLSYAAAAGEADIVRTLLDNGADINAKTDKDMTPLMLATINGHAHVVRDLVTRGAALGGQNYAGKTVLQLAQERLQGETRDEIVHLLKAAGAK